MDVTCERCGVVYEFDDRKITSETVRVKCTSCGNLFRVSRRTKSPEREPVALEFRRPESQASAHSWMVRRPDGSAFHFKELATLQRWIVERRVTRQDEISRSGEVWRKLGDLTELVSFFELVENATSLAEPGGRTSAPAPTRPEPPPSTGTNPMLPAAGGVQHLVGEAPAPSRPHRAASGSTRSPESSAPRVWDDLSSLSQHDAFDDDYGPEEASVVQQSRSSDAHDSVAQAISYKELPSQADSPSQSQDSAPSWGGVSSSDSLYTLDGEELEFRGKRTWLKVLVVIVLLLAAMGGGVRYLSPPTFYGLKASLGLGGGAPPEVMRVVSLASKAHLSDHVDGYAEARKLLGKVISQYPAYLEPRVLTIRGLVAEAGHHFVRSANARTALGELTKAHKSLQTGMGELDEEQQAARKKQLAALSKQMDRLETLLKRHGGLFRKMMGLASTRWNASSAKHGKKPLMMLATVDLFKFGTAADDQKRCKRGLATARTALGNHPYFLFVSGAFHARNGSYAEGRKRLKMAISAEPGYLRARFWLAWINAQKGDKAQALSELDKILRMEPKHSWSLAYKKHLLRQNPRTLARPPVVVGDGAAAKPAPVKGDAPPGKRGTARPKKPGAGVAKRRRPKRRKRVTPKGYRGLYRAAERLRRRERCRSAIRLYLRALELKKTSKALVGAGLCYLDTNRVKSAEKHFLRALKINRREGDAYIGLGSAYRQQGLKQAASRAYRNYLRYHPNGQEAAVARSALASLRGD